MTSPTSLEALARAAIFPHKGEQLGPNLLGYFLDSLFLGFEFMLFAHWAAWSWKDRALIRILVCCSVVFSLAVSCFNLSCLLHLFGFNFGEYANFFKADYIAWFGVLSVLPTVSTQLFYIDRAYRLNGKSLLIAVPTFALTLATLASGVGRTIILLSTKVETGYNVRVAVQQPTYEAMNYLWIISTLLNELTLAGLIVFGLTKSKSEWPQTSSTAQKALFLTVEAQLPSALIFLILALVRLIRPTSTVGTFFEHWHTKVFTLGLLVLLNSRFSLLKTSDGSENTWNKGASHLHQATINVLTETYIESSRVDPPKVGLNRDFAQRNSLDAISEDEDKDPQGYNDLSYMQNDSSMGLTTNYPEDIKVVLR
ncbi:hypothetical protein BD324DRAFT_627090 [Kockovaella imperatae]|uniref:DUF6534 domain-containing protein n=1 Tax=Kockovaella imperatae TaxID=4999 RepID=A0A1Y1UFD9_9TREE|nr:hypothetical protein BD324DRAFT_627090 [Kockovaella imperatae]ORX36763.1 hypothetical protein BD324DRAFT_627090 [Kockovaella imperatae]